MESSVHKRITRTFLFVWILAGLLLSVMAVQFRLSGSINLDHFYDVGSKFTVMYVNYTRSYEGLEYGPDGRYHAVSDDGSMYFEISDKKNRHWNYLYLDIRDLSTEKMMLQITSYKYDGSVVFDTVTEVREGMNEILLGQKASAGTAFRITDQEGISFRIQSMQFRKNPSFYGTKKVWFMMAVCMAVWLVFFGLLYILWLGRFQWERIYRCMDWLVIGYGRITGWMAGITERLGKKTRSKIRQLLFFSLILNMFLTEDFGSYGKQMYFHLYLLVNCVILFLIAVVSIEKERRAVNWRNPLMLSWLIYSIMVCISDIIVPKKQMFTGEMLLIIFGILYFAIAGMKRPVSLLYDFAKAVEYSYVISAIICLFCRPIEKMAEGRYIGITIGPYSYSAYLIVVIAILLAEVDRWLLEKGKISCLLFYLTGLISAYYFIWLTQSRAGLLAAGFCLIFFMIRVFKMRKVEQYGIRAFGTLFLCMLLALPVLVAQDAGLRRLADKLGTTVYFPNDYWMIGAPGEGMSSNGESDEILMREEYQGMFRGNYVYAAESETAAGRFLGRFPSLDILSSGRITIYKEHIGHLNLWGHKTDLSVGGMKYRAHNAILQVGYRYGIFTMIPYTVMVLYLIYYGICYLKKYSVKRKSYAMLPIILLTGCLTVMMLDNIERNFRYLPWVAFYLLIGFLGNTYGIQASEK